MPEAVLKGKRIYYETCGEGPPLIGLHYGLGSTKAWEKQQAAFGRAFSFVVYDRLGHGRSEPVIPYEQGYFENRAEELRTLLDHLGLDSAHLLGLCEGGAVALVFAAAFPERVNTLILQGVGYYGTDETIAECEKFFRPWPELSEKVKGEMALHHGASLGRQKFEAFREAKPYVWSREYDLRKIFPTIRMPALIMGGDRDRFFGLEHPLAAYRAIQGAELCIVPGAGHFVNHDAPGLFNTVVMDFLRRRCPSPGSR